MVYPNIRASPTKQLTGAAHVHVNRSDEERSAAGAGAFNGEKDGKSISLFLIQNVHAGWGERWNVCGLCILYM